MPRINDNFLKLKAGYLFPEIGRRVQRFVEANPLIVALVVFAFTQR